MTYLLLLLMAWMGRPAAAEPPLRQLVAIVDARYDALTTLRAHFTEVYSQGGLERRESGILYLRKPGLMRWDYLQPRRKMFLVTRHRVWLYLPAERQAQVRSLKSATNLKTPLRWLLGKLNLPRELKDMTYGGLNPLWPGDYVIRGKPAALGPEFREVLIEVSPAYNIRRLVIRAANGVQTDFQLRGIAANIPLPERLFRFHPPAGVQVVPAAQP